MVIWGTGVTINMRRSLDRCLLSGFTRVLFVCGRIATCGRCTARARKPGTQRRHRRCELASRAEPPNRRLRPATPASANSQRRVCLSGLCDVAVDARHLFPCLRGSEDPVPGPHWPRGGHGADSRPGLGTGRNRLVLKWLFFCSAISVFRHRQDSQHVLGRSAKVAESRVRGSMGCVRLGCGCGESATARRRGRVRNSSRPQGRREFV